jgi:hypothetical protein
MLASIHTEQILLCDELGDFVSWGVLGIILKSVRDDPDSESSSLLLSTFICPFAASARQPKHNHVFKGLLTPAQSKCHDVPHS